MILFLSFKCSPHSEGICVLFWLFSVSSSSTSTKASWSQKTRRTMSPSQSFLRTGCPLWCPSETGTGKGAATETRTGSATGTGKGTEAWSECGTCGRSARGRCSAESEPAASGSGTGIRSRNSPDRERMDDDRDPETGRGGGGRGARARRGRPIRRVMHTLDKQIIK